MSLMTCIAHCSDAHTTKDRNHADISPYSWSKHRHFLWMVRAGQGTELTAMFALKKVASATIAPACTAGSFSSDAITLWPSLRFALGFLDLEFSLTPPSPKTGPILGRGRRGAFSTFRLCARHVTLVDRSRAATGGRLLKCEQSSKDSRALANNA